LAVWLTLPLVTRAVDLEYQVKASYLFNFMNFVSWPAEAFDEDGRFHLCVVGAERFGSALDSLTDEQVDGRNVSLRRLASAEQASEAPRCHLLFVARGHADPNVSAVSRRGLLTIGEVPGFTSRGGVINLISVDGRIRFEVNQRAADDAGLAVSSRVLSLAVNKP
jgi:hypothetical protein